jgi:hypothetical protein
VGAGEGHKGLWGKSGSVWHARRLRGRAPPPWAREQRAGHAKKPGQMDQMDKPCNILGRGDGGGRRAHVFVREGGGVACARGRLRVEYISACWGLTSRSWGGTRALRWGGGCVESRGWGGGAGGKMVGVASGLYDLTVLGRRKVGKNIHVRFLKGRAGRRGGERT